MQTISCHSQKQGPGMNPDTSRNLTCLRSMDCTVAFIKVPVLALAPLPHHCDESGGAFVLLLQ